MCDKSEPESIAKFCAGAPNKGLFSIRAQAYPHRREDGIRVLGSIFPRDTRGRHRIYISKRCTNLISELLEYKVEIKEGDDAVDRPKIRPQTSKDRSTWRRSVSGSTSRTLLFRPPSNVNEYSQDSNDNNCSDPDPF